MPSVPLLSIPLGVPVPGRLGAPQPKLPTTEAQGPLHAFHIRGILGAPTQ